MQKVFYRLVQSFVCFCILGGCLTLVGCGFMGGYWSSSEIQARVVSPDGQPVQGAVVLATWEASKWLDGDTMGQIAVEEAVTDENGRFRIPGWEPRFIPHGFVFSYEPTLLIIRSGFVPHMIPNLPGMSSKVAPHRMKFNYQNQDLVIEPLQGDLKEYEERLGVLKDSLNFLKLDQGVPPWRRCYWEGIPNTLAEYQKIKNNLQRNGLGESLPSMEGFYIPTEQQCKGAKPTK